MKKIEIKDIYGNIRISGTFESLKDAVVKNKFNLSRCNIIGKDLSNCDLSKANMYETNLSESNLSGSNLSKCTLVKCDLSGANLIGCDLNGIKLHGCNLDRCQMDKFYMYVKKQEYDDYEFYCIGDEVHIDCEVHTIEEWENIVNKIVRKYKAPSEKVKKIRRYVEICKELQGLNNKKEE